MWITLFHSMLPINHSFSPCSLLLSFLLFPLLLFSSAAGSQVPLPSRCLAFAWGRRSPGNFAILGCILWCQTQVQWFVVCFRVNKHPGSVLQHFLHVLPHRTGHLAGFLPASLLQGQEADWVKEQIFFPLLSDPAGHLWDLAMASWSHLTHDTHWLELFWRNLDPKRGGEPEHQRQWGTCEILLDVEGGGGHDGFGYSWGSD